MAAATNLTDAGIKAAIERSKAAGGRDRIELRDSRQPGLILRVSGTGAATFYFVYRRRGKPQPIRFRLGAYPHLTLADARNMVAQQRGEMVKGLDPAARREVERQEQVRLAARAKFRDVAEEYLRERIPKEKNRKKIALLFTASLYPKLGDVALADIEASDAMDIYRAVKARGASVQAEHAFAYIRAVLNYAVASGYLEASPLVGKKVARASKPRDRVLTVDELRAFLTKLDTAPMFEDYRAILRLQLLLGQRIGEVAGMARHEIDLEARVWSMPAARCKNKRAHAVPLPPQARAIISERLARSNNRLLFPTKVGNPHDVKHICNALLAARDHFGFVAADGSPLPFTSHDLRRSVASYLRRLKFSSDVRDAILNHVTARNASVTEAHYTFVDLMSEKREALAAWDATLAHIAAGGDPFPKVTDEIEEAEERGLRRFRDNVVRLRRVS